MAQALIYLGEQPVKAPQLAGGRARMTSAGLSALRNEGRGMPRYKQLGAFQRWGPSTAGFDRPLLAATANCILKAVKTRDPRPETAGIWRMSVQTHSIVPRAPLRRISDVHQSQLG
jgi:hypothetical protein